MGAGYGTKTAPAATVAAASTVLLFAAAAAAAATAPAHAAEPYAQTDYPGLGVSVQTVADGLAVPWSIDWLPDGTAIFTERGGTVSVIRDGLPGPEAVLSVAVGGGAEGGLLGVAVDPNFEDNGHVYLYYTYNDPFSPPYNRIERYTYHDGYGGSGGATTPTGSPRLGDAHVILDRIPASSWHDGGRIQFGPDGMLYAATGDAIVPDLSQDASSLAGKILRMDRDGGAPAGNPWEGSLVYSMGHRNPQGMDWDRDGRMIITEHGPSGRLGVGHDEINVIVKGGNYGWPVVIGDSADGAGGTPYENPAFHTGGSTWAPSGAEFYESDVIPEWQGRYFVATLLGRTLQMVQLGPDGAIVSHEPLFEGEFGRLRDVQTGPDGHLYVLTSNRDGRGAPAPGDDRILRIAPLYEAAHGGGGAALGQQQQQQQLRVLTYDGPETADTGPLVAALRHPGYEVSSLAFDIGQKSLDFGFARSGASSGPGHAGPSLSLYVQRPLISAPFEVVVYDESGGMVPVSEASGHAGYLGGDGNGDGGATGPAAAYAVRHGPDHYIITVGTGLGSGHVAIIGAHVVPEYPSAIPVMAAAAVVVFAALVLAAAPPSLAHGGLRIRRSAGARNAAARQ